MPRGRWLIMVLLASASPQSVVASTKDDNENHIGGYMDDSRPYRPCGTGNGRNSSWRQSCTADFSYSAISAGM